MLIVNRSSPNFVMWWLGDLGIWVAGIGDWGIGGSGDLGIWGFWRFRLVGFCAVGVRLAPETASFIGGDSDSSGHRVASPVLCLRDNDELQRRSLAFAVAMAQKLRATFAVSFGTARSNHQRARERLTAEITELSKSSFREPNHQITRSRRHKIRISDPPTAACEGAPSVSATS